MTERLEVAPFDRLLSHTRFFLTLRSEQGKYHSLILFRLSNAYDTSVLEEHGVVKQESSEAKGSIYKQIYVMEASCPHLGADMSHADIEEYEDESIVAVCPWHRYDFDLLTGKSETGLRACTYSVEVRSDPKDGLEKVFIETPEGGKNWRLVEFRPVSEEFADPPPPPGEAAITSASTEGVDEPPVPTDGAPSTLIQWAVLILNTSNPLLKVERTRHAVQLFRTGQLTSIGQKAKNAPVPPDTPSRHDAYVKNTVNPGKLGRRKNRAVMLHALANIEQWAIDLAWDVIARFGPRYPDLPPAFFSDFAKVALDESKHFTLLTSRLSAISPETPYGSLPVHASLWESARVTADNFLARLAIINLVHEARGLDVNPATIERFRRQGDEESTAVLEIVHQDEVTHVTVGHRWFTWACEREGVDPVRKFREEVKRCWRGDVKGPFNVVDREVAGLGREFYEDLRGEMGWAGKERDKEDAQVGIEYEKPGL